MTNSNSNEPVHDSIADIQIPLALLPDHVTVLGYGSLLSEASARLTFPALTNFRYVKVYGLRRVFAHPHLFLIQEGLVAGMNMASLSVEHAEGTSSFVSAAFDVHLTPSQRIDFLERESSYDIAAVPFYTIESSKGDATEYLGTGVICLQGNDQDCYDTIQDLAEKIPFSSIWSWPRESGLLPANIYLRHCLLAAAKASDPRASESFRKDTYLVDRTTRLDEYLSKDPSIYQRIMQCEPPTHLAERFGG